MSTFEIAILTVLKNEGGFGNDINDAGGATNFGISLRWLRGIMPNADIDYVRNMSRETAIELYKKYWWDAGKYSLIIDQSVCTKLFDMSVNQGASQASKLIQRACWSVHGYGSLKDDGVLGDASIAAINGSPPLQILAAFRSEAAGFYRGLVVKTPTDKEFLSDWLERAYQ